MQFNRNRKGPIHWGVDGRSVDWLHKYLTLIIKKLFAMADAPGETGGTNPAAGCGFAVPRFMDMSRFLRKTELESEIFTIH